MRGATLLGKNRLDLKGTFITRWIASESIKTFLDFIERIFLKLGKESCELVIQNQDGHLLNILLTGIFDKDIQCLVSATDITEIRKLEKERLKETEFTKAAINTHTDVFIVFDYKKGNVIRWNDSFIELTGLKDEDISSINVHNDFFGLHNQSLVSDVFLRLETEGKAFYEMEYKKKNSTSIFEFSFTALNKNYETNDFVIAIGRDITERKRTELTEVALRNIAIAVVTASTMDEIIETIRMELNILFDVENLYIAFNSPEFESIRMFFSEVPELDKEALNLQKALVLWTIKQGNKVYLRKSEIESFINDGFIEPFEVIPECWLGVPLVFCQKIVGVIVVQSFTDSKAFSKNDLSLLEMVANDLNIFLQKSGILRELKLAKEKAEESDRLKSAFLANMSHEIRTPMNGILGFAELLKSPGLSGEQQQKYIRIIEKGGMRLLNIINDLINISKVEAGLMEINVSLCNVNEQLGYLHGFFLPEMEAKGLAYKLNIPDDIENISISTDCEKLYAILTNLVKNALKFTDAGFIELGVTLRNHVLVFYVKDSGVGISDDRKTKVFDRFTQGSELLTRNYEGSGLGLTISKAYVEILGGEIWLESELEKGSTFYFSLPCEITDDDATMIDKETSLSPPNEKTIPKLTILIVEDDAISGLLLQLITKPFEKKLHLAFNGKDAVEICREHPEIDLILMDLKMPLMDGYTATKLIRSFNEKVIIIAQTAFGLAGDAEKAMGIGCNEYIAKPFSIEELTNTIKKFF